jgi:hypothetical protein
MSTTLFYNGVNLFNCWTKSFHQRVEMDESDTDLLYHIFTIRVQSIVTPAANDNLGAIPIVTANDAQAIQRQLQGQLMHPRGDFRYTIGGNVVLEATADPNSLNRDVDNGPKPKDLEIVHIAGTRAMRVEFEIDVAVVICGAQDTAYDGYGTPNRRAARTRQVLNNRWSLEDTMDEDFYITRRWEGTLRVAHGAFNPHNYRNVVIPPLQAGFKRISGRFLATKDGLNLQYALEDKQVHAAPPSPATRWKGSYSEGATAGGSKGHAEVAVTLWGPPGARKGDLITAAIRVTETRLGTIRRNFALEHKGAGRIFLNSATITEKLEENSVTVMIRVTRVAEARRYLNMEVKKRLGNFLDEGPNRLKDYDHLINPVPDTYDSSTPAAYFTAFLQTPCDNRHGLPPKLRIGKEGDAPYSDGDKTDADYRLYETSEKIKDDAQPAYPDAQKDNVYTYIELETEYQTRRGFYQLPVAWYDSNGNGQQPREAALASKTVALHQPLTRRVTRVSAERIGTWPELPEPEAVVRDKNGIKETLLYDKIKTESPELIADGNTFVFRAGGFYVYAMERTPTANEKLRGDARQDIAFEPGESEFNGADQFTSGKITVADDPPLNI